MKTIKFIVTLVIYASITVFSACNEKLDSSFELDMYEKEIKAPTLADKPIELYQNFKQFIADRDPNSLQQINSYLNEKNESEILTTRNYVNKVNVLNNYLLENDIEEEQLAVFLEENPEKMADIVELICSTEFNDLYNNIKNTPLTEENIFVSQIYNELQLTYLEKTMLFLLLSSDKNADFQTRSIKSCIKRYAKLTGIAVKAIAISTVDPGAGVEYASKELEAMGPEYNC